MNVNRLCVAFDNRNCLELLFFPSHLNWLNVAMNYFVRWCLCIILVLIVGNFNSNCFNPEEVKEKLNYLANIGKINFIKNDAFKLEKDGFLGYGNYAVVWKGKKKNSFHFTAKLIESEKKYIFQVF